MAEFLKSSPALDKIVMDATSGPNGGFENMREQLKAGLVREGRLARDPESQGVKLIGHPTEPTPVPLTFDAASNRCERVLYLYQNSRIVITGTSEDEIDEVEARLRTALGAS